MLPMIRTRMFDYTPTQMVDYTSKPLYLTSHFPVLIGFPVESQKQLSILSESCLVFTNPPPQHDSVKLGASWRTVLESKETPKGAKGIAKKWLHPKLLLPRFTFSCEVLRAVSWNRNVGVQMDQNR